METISRTSDTKMETFNIIVPKIDMKRFKGIVKAMGWKIEKKTAIEQSLDEVRCGQTIKYESLDDLIKDI